MIKPIVEEINLERVRALKLYNVEIVLIDNSREDSVEIYMIDGQGNRVEGGTFSHSGLMNVIIDYYNRNY